MRCTGTARRFSGASALNLALFDFDGTITDRELFGEFLHRVVPRRRLAFGKIVLAPLVLGYRVGLVSGSLVRACVVRVGLSGVVLTQAVEAAAAFHRDVLIPSVRSVALERIGWHRSQGDVVVVVSGAFDLILSQWCREQQLELICSTLASVDGVLTGRYDGAQCVGAEKSKRVRERYDLARFPVVYAYGDTREDLSLLGLAHKRYFRWEEMD